MTTALRMRGVLTWGAAAVAGCAALLPSPSARACGGFFCNQAAPVDQQAEEIIFVDNGDDTTTMVIRIMYQGPADKFAWLLPVSGIPDVEVSSNSAFDNLRAVTDPRYELAVEIEGECQPGAVDGGADFDTGDGDGDGDSAGDDSGIVVLDEGSVGPFDYATIAVEAADADSAQVAVDWLLDNGYDVTSVGADVLRPYLDDGLNLIAFKLTKGSESGSIRPVRLTFAGSKPSIPIRPTAVAAVPDMGVRVWTISSARAVPTNYKSLELNEALINWFAPGLNYDAVVTAAANEAGGQGFVTELAASSQVLDGIVFTADDEASWNALSLGAFDSAFEAMQEARGYYSGWDGWRDVVCDSLELPSGMSCDDWGASPDPSAVSVSLAEFMTDLGERVVDPVRQTQALLRARPYMTRMYSTLSPAEMTLDPTFDFNPDLVDVSNVHRATQVIECSPDIYPWEAPYRVLLEDGGEVRGIGNDWPINAGDLPANLRIVQLSTRGDGEVVVDNREAIVTALASMEVPIRPVGTRPAQDGGVVATDPAQGDAGEIADGGADVGDDGGLCAVTHPGSRGAGALSAILTALALVCVAGRARRRRA